MAQARRPTDAMPVKSLQALHVWLNLHDSTGRLPDDLTVTFVIDLEKNLWISDRRTEHVACADCRPVWAAGEMTFAIVRGIPVVTSVTNQSTGYCPEPACWEHVRDALDALGLDHPGAFTPAFEFRRCTECGSINLIKEAVFECAVCNAPLSPIWNFGEVT